MAFTERQKAARTLGRLGGLKGGKARAQALSPERRKEIARNAVAARWAKSGKSVSAALPTQNQAPATPNIGTDFFAVKSIDQLIAEQGVLPVTNLSIFAGAIPDEDVDEFVGGIYRDR